MSWARWSIEPVGVGLEQLEMDEDLIRAIDSLDANRTDIDPTFSLDHVHLVRLAWRFDQDVTLNRMRSALNHVKQLVKLVERLKVDS